MNINTARDMASRFAAGESLSHTDQQNLLQWLEDRPEARHEFFNDALIDHRIRAWVRLSDTDDALNFIDSTMAAIEHGEPQALNESRPPRIEADSDREHRFSILVSEDSTNPTLPLKSAFLTFFAACLVLILLGGLSWIVFVGDAPVGNQPITTMVPNLPAQSHDVGFAKVGSANNATWKNPRVQGDRLSSDNLTLLRGTAEIQFDKGTTVSLTAPASLTLRSPDSVFLNNGNMAVLVPTPAIGFTVQTPVARIVDLGTEFDVSVAVSGATETQVNAGVVTFEPRSDGSGPGKPIRLMADGLNRAMASAPNVAGMRLPVSMTASGIQGQFLGSITANGQTMEFHSRQEFDAFQSRVNQQLQSGESGFHEQWSIMVESSSSGVRTQVQSRSSSGDPGQPPVNNARDLLLDQLRTMREEHQGNPRMQTMIDNMIRRTEEPQ